MLQTHCRLWKFTLIVLVLAAVALIVTAGLLSKTAKNNLTCPTIVSDCPDCKICVLNLEKEEEALTDLTIKPLSSDTYLTITPLLNVVFDTEEMKFSYSYLDKTITSNNLKIVYRFPEDGNFNPDIHTISSMTPKEYDTKKFESYRDEWYMAPDNGKILTYPQENGEKFYSLALGLNNKAILQENMETRNIIFEIV